jgi:enamine deaminase RidA (YjgF/YER057c/UK114 family)
MQKGATLTAAQEQQLIKALESIAKSLEKIGTQMDQLIKQRQNSSGREPLKS